MGVVGYPYSQAWYDRRGVYRAAAHTDRPAHAASPQGVKFAPDSPLEGGGFELSVPLRRATTSELSVPPAVKAVGARLPRKRPVGSAVGLASRSSIMLPSPRALRGAEPFGPSDRVQRCPSASQQRANRRSLSRSTLLS